MSCRCPLARRKRWKVGRRDRLVQPVSQFKDGRLAPARHKVLGAPGIDSGHGNGQHPSKFAGAAEVTDDLGNRHA